MKCAVCLIFLLISINSQSLAEELECEFVRHSDGYNCDVRSVFDVPKEVTAVKDNHKFGKGNTDVEVFFMNDNNKSKYVPTKVCRSFPNVYKFDIYGSSIVELRKELFEDCANLTKIVIKYVKFKTLPEDLLSNVANLTNFVLSFTHVEVLPTGLFSKNMATLKFVEMSFNKLKTITTEFPPSLTMLSVMNNECIDDHVDSRSTTRSKTVTQLIADVRAKCGVENENATMSLTYNEEELRLLKSSIDENGRKIKDLETSMQNSDFALGSKIATQTTEVRAMKTEVAQAGRLADEAIKKFRVEMTEKYEEFFKLTTKLNEESRQIKVKLEYNNELKRITHDLESEVGRNSSHIVVVFILQLVLIAFVVCAVIYFKFFARQQRGGVGLLSSGAGGDGNF